MKKAKNWISKKEGCECWKIKIKYNEVQTTQINSKIKDDSWPLKLKKVSVLFKNFHLWYYKKIKIQLSRKQHT